VAGGVLLLEQPERRADRGIPVCPKYASEIEFESELNLPRVVGSIAK
jgi:hypothetical protein